MATSDKFSRVSDSNTGRPVIAQLAAGKGVGATSISVNAATNWTTTSKIHFAIYNTMTVAGKLIKDTSTQTEWTGDLAGTTISNLTLTGGTDQTYLAGAYVELTPTAKYAKDLYDGLTVLHNPDGTFKAGAVSTTATLADSIVTTAKIADGSVTPAKLATGSTLLGINRNSGVATISTTYATYATFTGTTTGKRVVVDWNARLNNAGSGATRQFDVRVLCDGAAITPASESFTVPLAETPSLSYSGMSDSTPAAGSHTWTLQFQCSSSGAAVALGSNWIKVTEVA